MGRISILTIAFLCAVFSIIPAFSDIQAESGQTGLQHDWMKFVPLQDETGRPIRSSDRALRIPPADQILRLTRAFMRGAESIYEQQFGGDFDAFKQAVKSKQIFWIVGKDQPFYQSDLGPFAEEGEEFNGLSDTKRERFELHFVNGFFEIKYAPKENFKWESSRNPAVRNRLRVVISTMDFRLNQIAARRMAQEAVSKPAAESRDESNWFLRWRARYEKGDGIKPRVFKVLSAAQLEEVTARGDWANMEDELTQMLTQTFRNARPESDSRFAIRLMKFYHRINWDTPRHVLHISLSNGEVIDGFMVRKPPLFTWARLESWVDGTIQEPKPGEVSVGTISGLAQGLIFWAVTYAKTHNGHLDSAALTALTAILLNAFQSSQMRWVKRGHSFNQEAFRRMALTLFTVLYAKNQQLPFRFINAAQYAEMLGWNWVDKMTSAVLSTPFAIKNDLNLYKGEFRIPGVGTVSKYYRDLQLIIFSRKAIEAAIISNSTLAKFVMISTTTLFYLGTVKWVRAKQQVYPGMLKHLENLNKRLNFVVSVPKAVGRSLSRFPTLVGNAWAELPTAGTRMRDYVRRTTTKLQRRCSHSLLQIYVRFAPIKKDTTRN